MTTLKFTPEEMDFLLSPKGIRAQAQALFIKTEAGDSHFRYHPEKLKATVEFVLTVIRDKYPDLKIPFHSRWGHFRVGGVDRLRDLEARLSTLERMERGRTKLDLVITSVLLDAGAGMAWRYREQRTGQVLSRSEGLAVASLDLFESGALASHGLRADVAGMKALSRERLEHAFQVKENNPLVGCEGRVQLLHNLAAALESRSERLSRPGEILDLLTARFGKVIPATGILRAVLELFGPIWPSRLTANGVNLGDVWWHPKLGSVDQATALVPFHKLSQWMSYSLIEPIEESGAEVRGVEELTGLAEYRNGGLLIDSGLISFREPEDARKAWQPDSPLIIEWRALTVYLLDIIGAEVQKALGKTPREFPLAKVLEGGTWWAGRRLAQEKRADGGSPIQLASDGTVF